MGEISSASEESSKIVRKRTIPTTPPKSVRQPGWSCSASSLRITLQRLRRASNESQSDRSSGNTSSSHDASSQTVSALRRFPTALVCVGRKPSSLVTCATSNVRDEIRNGTVHTCNVRCAIRTTRRSACRGHSDDSRPFLRLRGNAITKSNKST